MTGPAGWSSSVAVFACSPRRGGNSDLAAELLAEGVRSAGGEARILYVRDHDIEPCAGCAACAKAPGCACPLMVRDQAEELFAPLLASPAVLFASPVFFYHFPARFKGFIDRGQRYYELKERGEAPLAGLRPRQAFLAMVAGRPTGEKLFEGSVLTLRYFLRIFDLRLADSLFFRGIDAPGDLAARADGRDSLLALGRRAWLERGE